MIRQVAICIGVLVFGALPVAADEGDKVRETIRETTQGELSGVDVGMGNMIQKDEYVLPDGSKSNGLTCQLFIPGSDSTVVGLDSEVAVGGKRWKVTAIHKTSGELGTVTLEQIGAPTITPAGDGSAWDAGPADPARLDFYFASTCPACGGSGGWDGTTYERIGQPIVGMRCTECGNAFGLYEGAREAEIRNPPPFSPGRGVA